MATVRNGLSFYPNLERLLSGALTARAELIVSGNGDFLALKESQGIRIVKPVEALRLLAGA